MTNWSRVNISFNAAKRQFRWICCLDKERVETRGISDKRHKEFQTSLSYESEVLASPTGETVSEFMLRSWWSCLIASILHVFDASTSSTLADFLCLFGDDRNSFPYPPCRLFSHFLFHFISSEQISGLAALSVLDCSSFVSDLSILESLPSSKSELISFAFLVQNQVPGSFSVSVISAVTELVVIYFKLRQVRKWAWFDSLFFEDLYWNSLDIFLLLKWALRNYSDVFEKKLLSFEYSWLGVNMGNNDSIRVLLPNFA